MVGGSPKYLLAQWDEALLTMTKGEKAEITIQPEWAYGKKGLEGKYPLQNSYSFFSIVQKVGSILWVRFFVLLVLNVYITTVTWSCFERFFRNNFHNQFPNATEFLLILCSSLRLNWCRLRDSTALHWCTTLRHHLFDALCNLRVITFINVNFKSINIQI